MVPVPVTDEIYDQGDKIPPNSNKDTSSGHQWESELHTVDRLISHKSDEKTSTVEFVVKWVNGKTTNEPEWILQEYIPTLIYESWKKRGGRKEVTGFTSDYVFRILDFDATRGKKAYRVQWVGYPAFGDWTSWEDERTLRKIARVELKRFNSQQVK